MKYIIAYTIMIVSMMACVFGPIYSAHYRTQSALSMVMTEYDADIPSIQEKLGRITHYNRIANYGLYATAIGALAFSASLISCLTLIRRDIKRIENISEHES